MSETRNVKFTVIARESMCPSFPGTVVIMPVVLASSLVSVPFHNSQLDDKLYDPASYS